MKTIVLVGSMRFADLFTWFQRDLALNGHVVLGLDYNEQKDPFFDAWNEEVLERAAATAKRVHLRKIELADEVFVINPGSYIGAGSAQEIAYARTLGKPIQYLVEPDEAT